MSNDNIDFDEFNELINKIDSTIGNKSSRHKDTLMAQSIIMTRGKELRNEFRNVSTYEKYDRVIEYLTSLCPDLQEDKLRFALFREGFIRESVVDAIPYILYISIGSPFIIFIMFYSNMVVPFKMLLCVMSFFGAAIPVYIIEEYTIKKGLTLYFGLGHKK